MAKDQKDQKPKKERRFHPIRFLKEVAAELKKVTWPSRKDLVGYTLAVIVFVILLSVVVGVLDLVFQQGFLLIIS
jgi:preprotein translocase subunit SecE